MAKKMIVLKSSDNEIFEIEEIVAQQSVMIDNMIHDSCANSVIPLPNVTGKTLAKVIEYCKRHAHPPAPHPDRRPWTKAWELLYDEEIIKLRHFDEEFVDNVDQKLLFDLILASNYLEIESLLDLTCKKVADMISLKTPEEIRKTFNIVNDLTPEEEEEIRRENAWAFETEREDI